MWAIEACLVADAQESNDPSLSNTPGGDDTFNNHPPGVALALQSWVANRKSLKALESASKGPSSAESKRAGSIYGGPGRSARRSSAFFAFNQAMQTGEKSVSLLDAVTKAQQGNAQFSNMLMGGFMDAEEQKRMAAEQKRKERRRLEKAKLKTICVVEDCACARVRGRFCLRHLWKDKVRWERLLSEKKRAARQSETHMVSWSEVLAHRGLPVHHGGLVVAKGDAEWFAKAQASWTERQRRAAEARQKQQQQQQLQQQQQRAQASSLQDPGDLTDASASSSAPEEPAGGDVGSSASDSSDLDSDEDSEEDEDSDEDDYDQQQMGALASSLLAPSGGAARMTHQDGQGGWHLSDSGGAGSSDLDDTEGGNAGGGRAKRSKQFLAALEIVTTERTYMEGLHTMMHSFYKPLMARITLDKRVILSRDELNGIFSTLDQLYELSASMVADLEELVRQEEEVFLAQVATTLLHYSEQFTKFQPYLENFDRAAKLVADLQANNDEFKFFCEVARQVEGLSLESFLITPIQRLPRYLLLLRELEKRTPPQSLGFSDICAATKRIAEVADSINASLREKEDLETLRGLAARMDRDERWVDLVVPGRSLEYSGVVTKLKSWATSQKKNKLFSSSRKDYLCFLFTDMLLLAVMVGGKWFGKSEEGRFRVKQVVPLDSLSVTTREDKELEITTKDEVMVWLFTDPVKLQQWSIRLQQTSQAFTEAQKQAKLKPVGGRTRGSTLLNSKAAKLMGGM